MFLNNVLYIKPTSNVRIKRIKAAFRRVITVIAFSMLALLTQPIINKLEFSNLSSLQIFFSGFTLDSSVRKNLTGIWRLGR